MNTRIRIWLRDGISLVMIIVLAVLLGTQMPIWYKQFKGPFKKGDYANHISGQPYALTLYGTTTCPHCKTAREFLKQEGIQFNDQLIDQSQVAKAQFKSLGEDGVPVLVSSDRLLSGFNLEAYRKLVESVKKAELVKKREN